jgi:hypothetical protein
MEKHVITNFKQNYFVKGLSVFFAALVVWWLSIYIRGLTEGPQNNAYTLIYPFLSLIGGLLGLIVAKKWGGLKSMLGKAISMFSFGLLAQFLGQAIYAYYIYVKGIEVPYPSWGDLGYFGSVIFYILGSIYLIKVTGFKFSIKSLKGKILLLVIPIILLKISYFFFLQGYEYDMSNKLKVLLDFGYPLGQAIYVSIALLAYLMCRNFMGGLLKKPLIFIIIVLVFQYLCDFTFLYQASRGTWYVGGINDFMYSASYFMMTLALIYIGSIFKKIQES